MGLLSQMSQGRYLAEASETRRLRELERKRADAKPVTITMLRLAVFRRS